MERVSDPTDTTLMPMTRCLPSSPQTTNCSRSRPSKQGRSSMAAVDESRMGSASPVPVVSQTSVTRYRGTRYGSDVVITADGRLTAVASRACFFIRFLLIEMCPTPHNTGGGAEGGGGRSVSQRAGLDGCAFIERESEGRPDPLLSARARPSWEFSVLLTPAVTRALFWGGKGVSSDSPESCADAVDHQRPSGTAQY